MKRLDFSKVFIAGLLLFNLSAVNGSDLSPKRNKVDKTHSMKKIGAETITQNGYLIDLKEFKHKPLPPVNERRMKPHIKKINPKKIVRESRFQDSKIQKKVIKTLIPKDNKAFDGMDFNTNGNGWPPDTVGDVGANYYVQAVNTSIAIYSKSDGELKGSYSFDQFFEGAAVSGTPCDEDNNGDPIVLYDRYASRWFILDFAWASSENDGSFFSIAVSKTSDPTGEWWLYPFRADQTLMADYPKCGVWEDGIYITANMFAFNGGFQGVRVWALNKTDLYSGTLNAQTVFDNGWYAWSILPSNSKGANPPAAGTPNYMFSYDADEWGYSQDDVISIWEYQVDWVTPGNTTWTGPTLITTSPFSLLSTSIPQKDTTNTLDGLGSRLMYSAFYRNYGETDAVYLNMSVDSGSVYGIRWMELSAPGGTPSLTQEGTFSPDSHHRWMGSIASDSSGNIVIGYSTSSSSIFPGIRVAGRLASDPDDELSQGESLLVPGTGHQLYYERWGDYSCMSIDPVDDTTFWYTTEYLVENGLNWKTKICSFKMPIVDVKNDFDNDSSPDILWRNSFSGQNVVWYMDNATKLSHVYLKSVLDTDWRMSGSGDFNFDNKTDILWRHYGTGQNTIWYMDGVSRDSYVSIKSMTDLNWNMDGVADFNGDGDPDILWRNYSTGQNTLWYMNGATKDSHVYLQSMTDLNWHICGADDFDSDGDPDILWRNYSTGQNTIWYMNGATKDSHVYLQSMTDLNWHMEGTGDYNSDGHPDIIWRNYSTGKNTIWFMNGATKVSHTYIKDVTDLNWDIENK